MSWYKERAALKFRLLGAFLETDASRLFAAANSSMTNGSLNSAPSKENAAQLDRVRKQAKRNKSR